MDLVADVLRSVMLRPRRVSALFLIVLLGAGLVGPVAPAEAGQPSGEIRLESDAAVDARAAADGWPGSGTPDDPYVISGYDITAPTGYGVLLWQVTRSIHVVNNTIAARVGVYAYETEDLRIDSNIMDVTQYGVHVPTSNRVSVIGNHIAGDMTYGVHIRWSGNVTIADNVVEGAELDAIAVAAVAEAVVTGNVVRAEGWHGIKVSQVDGASHVANNSVENQTIGIRAYLIQGDARIVDNVVTSSGSGISLSSLAQGRIQRNMILENEDGGIHLSSSDGAVLVDNAILGEGVGIMIWRSSGVHIEGNHAQGTPGLAGYILDGSRIVDNVLSGHRGASVDGSDGVLLQGNWIEADDGAAVSVTSSTSFEFTGNRFRNGTPGLSVWRSEGLVYNNIFDNVQNVRMVDRESIVLWNVTPFAATNIVGGPVTGGNWWNDYTGADVTLDGIGEVPHGPLPYNSLEGTGAVESRYKGQMPYGPWDRQPLVADEVATVRGDKVV